MTETPLSRPWQRRLGRAALRAARGALFLLIALALPLPGRPVSAQAGPLAPAAAQSPEEAAAAPGAPAATETPAQRRERLLVETLRRPSGWLDVQARILAKLVDFVPALAAALLVLLVFYGLYRISARLLQSLLRRTRADPAVREIGVRLTKFVLLGFGLVMAASQLGFQVGSLLAGVGIVGIAVGLAAQDSLANLVAGITILWDHPFRIGDHVTISGTYGRVKEIGLRTTKIFTMDHIDAILPNKDVINQKIFNHTLTPELRIGVPVSIGYREDVREARRVLIAAVLGHPLVLAEPAPTVVVTQLADSAVNLELRVWAVDPHREREVFFALLEMAKLALDEAGIEIPFPQQTLRFAGDGSGRPLAVEVRNRLRAAEPAEGSAAPEPPQRAEDAKEAARVDRSE